MKQFLLFLISLILSSCDQEKNYLIKLISKERKELFILHSDKSFYISPHSDFIEFTGIWKLISNHGESYGCITNNEKITYPHAVKITCSKNISKCGITETIMGRLHNSDKYYITSNTDPFFIIKTWSNNKIIAINRTSGVCLYDILYIDINTQEAFIKSVINNKNSHYKHCKTIKEQLPPIVYKLIDSKAGAKKYYIDLIIEDKKVN